MYLQTMTMKNPSYGDFIGYVAKHIKNKTGNAMLFNFDNTIVPTIQFSPDAANDKFELHRLNDFDMQMPHSWVTLRRFMIQMYDHSRSDQDNSGREICGKLSGVVQLFEGVRQSLELFDTPEGLQNFVRKLQEHSRKKAK